MKTILHQRMFHMLGLGLLWSLNSLPVHAENVQLTVTDGTYTIPSESAAILTMRSTTSYDVICNVKVTGIIKGHDPSTGLELTARQSSESVQGFILKSSREHERRFDFSKAVKTVRNKWRDPQAVLVEVGTESVTADCQRYTGASNCDWPDPDRPDPACNKPITKPCDWSNPDWSNPACGQ